MTVKRKAVMKVFCGKEKIWKCEEASEHMFRSGNEEVL